MTEKLTIAKILERPYFQNAQVYANDLALKRTIEWAHVLEVEDVGNLLNGNELILTTGLTWKGSETKCLKFLREIIDKHAAGLVIDMGRVVEAVPDRMIEIAENENFPLILIFSDIRYIDVTHDVHTYLINQQKKMLEDLEHFSSQLNSLLLMGEGVFSLLKLFFKFTGHAIAYIPVKGQMIYVPHSGYFKNRLDSDSAEAQLSNRELSFPILVMGQSFGHLVINSSSEDNRFTSLALDRCATAVAQELLRSMYWEEKQLNQENHWVAQWMDGQLDEKVIKDNLWKIKPNITFNWCGAVVIESSTDNRGSAPSVSMHQSIILRTVFRNESLFVLPVNRSNRVYGILLDLNGLRNEKVIDGAIVKAMNEYKRYNSGEHLTWGVSGKIQPLNCIHQSVSEALEVIEVQSHIGLLQEPFHHALHIYQIINQMNQSESLMPFIENQIGKLLTSQNERDNELLQTLKIYLECGGAKKEAAEKLFISRQSLYKRLDRINARLGGGIEKTKRRLAIELALVGFDYLNGSGHVGHN